LEGVRGRKKFQIVIFFLVKTKFSGLPQNDNLYFCHAEFISASSLRGFLTSFPNDIKLNTNPPPP